MKKRYVILMTVSIVLIAALITGSLAFMTSTTGKVSNVVTLGDIEIELDEPAWSELEDLNSNKIPDLAEAIFPNQTLPKDPTITNTGTNSAYVFVKIQVPKKIVKYVNKAGEVVTPTEAVDLFFYETNDDWVKFFENTSGSDFNEYYYYYKDPIATGYKSSAVFNQITYIDAVEGQIENEKMMIDVTAYGAQVSEYEADNKNIAAWNELAIQENLPLCE